MTISVPTEKGSPMIEKSRTYLNKELRNCFRNKKHAIERNATETEINAISEKISIIQFLLRCVDTVETMEEREEDDG